MSNTIDSRIVEMKFDNAQFERGVSSTMKSLDALKKGLKLDGATSGLDHLNKSASKFSLGNISSGLSGLASKFSALSVIGVTALATIASKAVSAGISMVKSLSLSPLKDGLQEYETNLNSVQTILANTGLEGQKGLNQVNAALNELNKYSDQTIYNFSEMARNIGTFTAAGVDLKTSTAAIKGIANLAAVSGSSSEQASTAMYQLSQALSTGKVSLQDWNSVVNAGMGGKVFQNSLVETAKVHGVAVDKIIKDEGSFRDSLQKGWLTSDILTETLNKFAGDLNAKQLKSMGYNEQQIAGILKMGKTAQDAATKVKTVSQLIGTLQEAAGSGWSQTFQLLFGDFNEAKSLFTDVSNVLGGFINASSNARNQVIGDWKKLGGRTELIKGIAIAFNNVMDVLTPIKKAFRDIFPPTTGKQLYNLTVGFRQLMENMRLNEDTMDNVRATFRGLFAIIDIGIQLLKGVGTVILSVFKSFSGGSGGILEFTGNIGDWLVALDEAIKKGDDFTKFFKDVAKVILIPLAALKAFIGVIKDLVSGLGDINGPDVGSIFAKRFAPLAPLGGVISKAWSKTIDVLKGVFKVFEPLAGIFTDFFSNFGDVIANGIANIDYNKSLDAVNTGLLAGLVLVLKKFLSGGVNIDLGGGILDTIKESFEGLTGVMSAMQTQLKASALIKIAGAIALLTASVVALSLIDSKKLTVALGGLAAMFTQLLAAMAIFEKITASKGFIKMPFLTASMIALAIAIDLLAIAVTNLSKLNWEELAKGLTGVAVLLGSLALFTKFSGANTGGLSSGAGLILLALGINILVNAVKDMATMDWGSMAKGLTGVAALLVSLALFTKLSDANKGGIAQGAGLILLALAIKVLASAMKDLGQLSWTEIGKGLVVMAGGLAIMGTALALIPPSSVLSAAAILIVASSLKLIGDAVASMGSLKWSVIGKGLTTMAGALTLISLAIGLLPPSSLLSAAAIFVVASSLQLIAAALGTMGGMTWEQIAKGLIVLAGSLTIIALALYGMTAALPGAAALLVATAALKLLAPVLLAFGNMSWGEIVKGLTMLAGVFVVLGVAGLLLAPIVPVLLALGVSITLLGVGMLAAGAGLFLFSAGLTALAVAGSAGAAAIVGIVKQLIGVLPQVAAAIGQSVIAFATVIAKAGPAITKAITTVLLALLNAINKLAPKIVQTLSHMLDLMLAAMIKYVPKLADAGLKILTGVLNAIAKNIGKVVKAGADIIVNFLNGINKEMPRVLQAGANLIIGFVNNLAKTIRNNSGAMRSAGLNLATAIVDGMTGGLASGAGRIASKAKDVASSALNAAKNVLGIHSPSKEFKEVGRNSDEGLAIGLDKYKVLVTRSAEKVGDEAIDALGKSLSSISDIVTTDDNFTPIIRPVLDLTDLKKTAQQIDPMLTPKPLDLSTTNAKAKDASAGVAANAAASQPDVAAGEGKGDITFIQNNNSPKALSAATLYRQTNNQLSTAKGALKK